MTIKSNQKLYDENETAAWLDLQPKTLQSWRYQKIGIPFIKVGRSVRYRKSDDVKQSFFSP